MIFALIGNQNCGKTTLFNQLTGANQHVGNFPGVTVDQKVGEIKEHKNCSVVDLPGIYSLRPYTSEEIVTRDFLINEKPDAIINIVDATNIERNLYLTLQLLEMQIPMVLALNMMDEVRNNGGSIDVMGMSEKLGIPVVPISAVKAEGISELVEKVIRTAEKKKYPKITDFCEKGPVHRCIHALSHQVEDHAQNLGISPRFAATKVVENDVEIIKKLNFSRNEFEMMQHSIEEMEADHQEFTRLIRENQAILYDFIKCRILDKSLAQDVLQETLYIAYKKWDQLKEHPNQTGFLIETARYKIQDFNKKTRKLQREIPIEGHEHIEAKDQYGKVELDIVLENNLDKEDKKRLSRYFVRGFKIPEMAKLENTSENNMSVRINRLRGKVAKVIYDGKVFDKKQKMSVRNDKKETHIIERDKGQASKPDDEIQKGIEQK